MERVASKEEARRAVAEAHRERQTVALVPTMGALHEGHLTLVRAACERADYVVVSVFVNPTQFAEGEDFESYPRDLDGDLGLLAGEGVDLVFTPSVGAMYAPDAAVSVDPGPLARHWEGEVRPGHFTGVATIVTKLLSVLRPDLAFFGEKDYQQLRVIERLVIDLDLGVRVVRCPIVRDTDGLALSSRNAYLSAAERAAVLALPAALEAATAAAAGGEREAHAIERAMLECTAGVAGLALDYAIVVDPVTLEPVDRIEGPARALIAGRVGATRLIDNVALTVGQTAGRADSEGT